MTLQTAKRTGNKHPNFLQLPRAGRRSAHAQSTGVSHSDSPENKRKNILIKAELYLFFIFVIETFLYLNPDVSVCSRL